MRINFFSKFMLVFISVLLSLNLYAQGDKEKNLYDDCNVLFSVGTLYHAFTDKDDFRNSTGLFGSTDEIKGMGGLYFNAELLLNDTFSLSLPVGLSAGYRIQTMEGGFKYSTVSGYTVERKVQIINNIGYLNIGMPVDDAKYWIICGSAGFGASKYKVTYDYSNPATADYNKSSNGFVIPLSVFLDWGADGIGARFGYTYVISKYPEIDGKTPKGDGSQFFIDLRYAI